MSQPRVWVFGSAPECDVVINRPTISGKHCRLVRINDQYYIDDLNSTNGTFVNGNMVAGRVAVARTDKIILGSNFPLPWPDESVAAPVVVPTPAPVAAPKTAASRVITIGRETDNDVVLPFNGVSAHHARITFLNDQIILDDLNSTNGTYLGNRENRVTHAAITAADILFFGSMRIPASQILTENPHFGEQPQAVVALKEGGIILGRSADCDQVLDYPMISQRHARIYQQQDQTFVEDLRSANGTFVNGQRIRRPTQIQPGDSIGLGSYSFLYTESGRFEKRDFRGNVAVEAKGVTIDVRGRRLLDDVSLTLLPTEFVGLMGPSGAGKTTLMNCLNGYTPPTSGTVLFNGLDLYDNYGQFSHQLGYVPQDDIIHRDLTVGQALYYTAKLRLPPDTTEAEIQDRIKKVVQQLGLEGTENVLIGSPEKKGISGGQRKRVNLAMELLTDPSVLFLDEPTSGLSSEDALKVMQLLRKLADTGKVVLLTIHQPSLEAYRLMDNLVLVGKDKNSVEPGKLVYYGPAYPEAVTFFNPQGVPNLKPGAEASPDEILRGFSNAPSATWREKYLSGKFHKQFVADRMGRSAAHVAKHGHQLEPPKVLLLRQWYCLISRYLLIKAKDIWNTAILLAQAPIVGGLVVLVFARDVSQEVTNETWLKVAERMPMTLFMMGLSALWFGCSNAVREIVGEWAIYHRERMVNLRLPTYVFSKLVALGGLCAVQCFILLVIVHTGCGLKGSPATIFATLLAVSWVGVGLGLLLSAVAKTTEVAIALLPIILLPMVILGGVMQPIHEMHSTVECIAQLAPSRWAFENLISEEADRRPLAPKIELPAELGPAPLAKAEGGRANSKQEAQQPDMAEKFFPLDRRWRKSVGFVVMGAMASVLIVAVHMILRFRDIH